MSSQILKAGTVITMNPRLPRAEAVAVTDGHITAVGSLADCREASPDAEVVNTGWPRCCRGSASRTAIR